MSFWASHFLKAGKCSESGVVGNLFLPPSGKVVANNIKNCRIFFLLKSFSGLISNTKSFLMHLSQKTEPGHRAFLRTAPRTGKAGGRLPLVVAKTNWSVREGSFIVPQIASTLVFLFPTLPLTSCVILGKSHTLSKSQNSNSQGQLIR